MPDGALRRVAEAGLSATAEALFPSTDSGAPDYLATDLVRRTLAYWDELPAPQRRLMVALYVLVELGAPLLGLGWGRFSSLTVERRERGVRALRSSSLLPLRLIGDAIKATTTVMYMSHPAALRHIGAPAPPAAGGLS